MITYTTQIDTLSIQLNFGNANTTQRSIQTEILNYIKTLFNPFIDPVEYYVGFDKRIVHKIYCNGRTVVSFQTGYSHNNFFIKIIFAGLQTYDIQVDMTSSNYLWVIVAYINTRQLRWDLSELDIAIDVPHVKFENLLAICTSHTSRTKYHILGEVQRYDGQTTYIEKFETEDAKNTAIKRSYIYYKTLKEQVVHNNILGFSLQRYEIKFQSPYFNKYGFDIDMMKNTLNMYHLMYFDDIADKNVLIDRYNNYQSTVRKREIDRWGFDKFRLNHDMDYINNFIYMLKNIDNNDIFGNLSS